jgi:phytanoyl-CoA hydroxylase
MRASLSTAPTVIAARAMEAERRDYEANGFAVLRNFVPPDELHLLRRELDSVVTKILESTWEHNQGDPDRPAAKVFLQCFRPSNISSILRQFILGKPIGTMINALTGASGFRLWLDQALYKLPHSNQTPWHIDQVYWPFAQTNATTAWIPFADCAESDGCLYYLPGSHKKTLPLRPHSMSIGIESNMDALFSVYPELAAIAPVPVRCSAGDIVFHSGLAAHAAGPNISTKIRRAYSVSYMPPNSRFNGIATGLPFEFAGQLKIGDLLNEDHLFPIVTQEET